MNSAKKIDFFLTLLLHNNGVAWNEMTNSFVIKVNNILGRIKRNCEKKNPVCC